MTSLNMAVPTRLELPFVINHENSKITQNSIMMKAQLVSLEEKIEVILKLRMIQLFVKVHFRIDLSWVERWKVLDWTRQGSSPSKIALSYINTQRTKRQSRTECQRHSNSHANRNGAGMLLVNLLRKGRIFLGQWHIFLHNFKRRISLKPLFAPYLKLQEVQQPCILLLLGWVYPDDFNKVLKGH